MRKTNASRDEQDAVAAGTEPEATGDALPTPDFSLPPALEETVDQAWDAGEDEPAATPRRWTWVAPSVFVALALAWTAWFASANLVTIAAGNPFDVMNLIGMWAPPPLCLAVIWLIAQRSSLRETERFTHAARMLSEESARLETRLTVVNRELSLAREFIAAQAQDIDSLGRRTAERLGEHGNRLAELIQDNSARVDAIGTVSAAALENMDRLRGQLPVITSAAKDVTNHIGNAGRTAHAQLQDLIAGFNRLNEFGQASERQVFTLHDRLDEILSTFTERSEAMDLAAQSRCEALTRAADDFHARLLDHQEQANALIDARAATLSGEIASTREALEVAEAEGLTSLRARLGALRDEAGAVARSLRDGEAAALSGWQAALAGIDTAIEQNRERIAEAEASLATASAERMAALEDSARTLEKNLSTQGARLEREIARRLSAAEDAEVAARARLGELLASLDAQLAEHRTMQEQGHIALAASADAARTRLDAVEQQIAGIHRAGQDVELALGERLHAIDVRFAEARTALAETEATIGGLTDSSVRLLELIQAGARHSSEDLVVAIGKGEARLGEVEARASALGDRIITMHGLGAELSDYVLQSHERLASGGTALTSLHDEIEARTGRHAEALDALAETLTRLHESVATLEAEAGSAAALAKGELTESIAALDTAARNAVSAIEQGGTQAVAGIAERLGEESSAAIEKSVELHMAEVGGKLEQAAAHAWGVSREASAQLRDQLAKVNELVGALESRVNRARSRAEEQIDNDFARRAALITESLNSNAIDIAKALDQDIGDSAWSAYLRGDRGIFTRRAVRLLDASDARSVTQIYESDRDFREHVARYIHDFEAMLRQLLSTRDGHALGVTLLSSDMGKLYVALAQAIERLRA